MPQKGIFPLSLLSICTVTLQLHTHSHTPFPNSTHFFTVPYTPSYACSHPTHSSRDAVRCGRARNYFCCGCGHFQKVFLMTDKPSWEGADPTPYLLCSRLTGTGNTVKNIPDKRLALLEFTFQCRERTTINTQGKCIL